MRSQTSFIMEIGRSGQYARPSPFYPKTTFQSDKLRKLPAMQWHTVQLLLQSPIFLQAHA